MSCDPVLPEVERPPSVDASSLELVVEPQDRGAAVVRLALVGDAAAQIGPADVWLVEGVVSEVSLSRWAEDDPPKTLLEHKVPTTSFVEEGSLRLIPHEPLVLALEHSVVVRSAVEVEGFALTFWTAESAPAHAVRRWPPHDVAAEGEDGVDGQAPMEVERAYAVYCVDVSTAFDGEAAASLEPMGPSGRFSPLGDRCVIFEPDATEPQSGMFHPPRSWGGVDLDPAPIRLGLAAPVDVEPLVCREDEVTIGALCAQPQDDRVLFRVEAREAFYAVQLGGMLALHIGDAARESSFELRGLTPESTTEIDVRRLTASDSEETLAQVKTTSAQPHIDIAEVMADPNGPEPEQEWIELHNDGLGTVELEGLVLSDAAGEVALTPFLLEPDARVLLVREGFEDETLDWARVIVLARLGGNGLSNAGEELSLQDAAGAPLSTFPSSPKPKAGVSTSLLVDAGGVRSWVHTDPATPLEGLDEGL